jgi:phosphate acetyltransferase
VSRSLYLASAGPATGKSAVALGVFEAMTRRVSSVAPFRPVVRAGVPDPVVSLLRSRFDLPQPEATYEGVTYEQVRHDPAGAVSSIVDAYRGLEDTHDAVLVVGTDYTDVGAPTELDFNGRVAVNLAAPVLVVAGGHDRSPQEVAGSAGMARAALEAQRCEILGVLANRVRRDALDQVRALLPDDVWTAAVPEVDLLAAPTVRQMLAACGGRLTSGASERLDVEVLDVVVAAMTLPHVLEHLTNGALVMTPGDRADVLVGVLMAHRSRTFPRLSGVLLTGGLEPEPEVARLVGGIGTRLPVAVTSLSTYGAASAAAATRGALTDGSDRKVDAALALFAEHVDSAGLLDRLDLARSEAVTPLMFEHDLVEKARQSRRRIVLAEGTETRVLRAAAQVLARRIADLVLLGDPDDVQAAADQVGADISAATVVDPHDPAVRRRLADAFARLRAHKGVTADQAYDTVVDPSYAGTLMVELGEADGMVSGAVHTTAQTIRPAFEIIRTVPGVSVVSSVFFMCLSDRVLVYGDCAVIPDPTAEQLADIAVSSAATAEAFGVPPRVAMLSYSTGESGTGADVEKVRAATSLVRERAPGLQVEGPIQYDAAIDAGVAHTKLPGSGVAGRATVFVFPDLNTGNNTYKAVQRSAGAVAVGPVLQGLRRPVNDLSRGATVADIVTTIAITAVQAQLIAASPVTAGTPVEGPV